MHKANLVLVWRQALIYSPVMYVRHGSVFFAAVSF